MRKQSWSFAVVVALLVAVSPVVGRASVKFTALGDLPYGSFNSQANAVSADGSVVVGNANDGRRTSFRWTDVAGMQSLEATNPDSIAYGVSANGDVVVGMASVIGAYRWSSLTGMQGLGPLGGVNNGGVAYGISHDGQIVVGWISGSSGVEAFRWTEGSGAIGLGDLPGGDRQSEAMAVSGNGQVIVGRGSSTSGSAAFRWTESGGMLEIEQPDNVRSSTAYGVSADGQTIVGSRSYYRGAEAFLWTESTGAVGLGDLPGGFDFVNSIAYGVSGDGRVVVGEGSADGGHRAFIWDESRGMRDLQAMLMQEYDLSTDLAGWSLNVATAISADGRTIVGLGANPQGYREAWRVQFADDAPPSTVVPAPSSMTTLIGVGVMLVGMEWYKKRRVLRKQRRAHQRHPDAQGVATRSPSLPTPRHAALE